MLITFPAIVVAVLFWEHPELYRLYMENGGLTPPISPDVHSAVYLIYQWLLHIGLPFWSVPGGEVCQWAYLVARHRSDMPPMTIYMYIPTPARTAQPGGAPDPQLSVTLYQTLQRPDDGFTYLRTRRTDEDDNTPGTPTRDDAPLYGTKEEAHADTQARLCANSNTSSAPGGSRPGALGISLADALTVNGPPMISGLRFYGSITSNGVVAAFSMSYSHEARLVRQAPNTRRPKPRTESIQRKRCGGYYDYCVPTPIEPLRPAPVGAPVANPPVAARPPPTTRAQEGDALFGGSEDPFVCRVHEVLKYKYDKNVEATIELLRVANHALHDEAEDLVFVPAVGRIPSLTLPPITSVASLHEMTEAELGGWYEYYTGPMDPVEVGLVGLQRVEIAVAVGIYLDYNF